MFNRMIRIFQGNEGIIPYLERQNTTSSSSSSASDNDWTPASSLSLTVEDISLVCRYVMQASKTKAALPFEIAEKILDMAGILLLFLTDDRILVCRNE